ncbi:hypothetical protein [Flagellimonas beolgyonensis]|uniref:hypothetical protein n=1 Tax=Flagellimonas beolgyonensis TaxID=864064 RepID=UPI003D647C6F
MEHSKSPFDRKYWSRNRYAWVFAGFILVLALLFGAILKLSGIYEGMSLRTVNVLFVLLGFLVLIWDYKRNTRQKLSYIEAFLLLVRTGAYFCLLFLPTLMAFIDFYHGELALVRANETLTSDYPVIQIVFSTYLETVVTVVVCALIVAFTANMGPRGQKAASGQDSR